MNIIVVSPDPVLPEFLRRPLAPLGHKLITVASAAQLKREVGALRPRAVLIPRRLPEADIPDLVAFLRAQFDDYAIATIIIGVEVNVTTISHIIIFSIFNFNLFGYLATTGNFYIINYSFYLTCSGVDTLNAYRFWRTGVHVEHITFA